MQLVIHKISKEFLYFGVEIYRVFQKSLNGFAGYISGTLGPIETAQVPKDASYP
jgi:hypothetical protein